MGSGPSAREQELQREYALRFAGAAAYRNAVWQVLTRDFFQRHVPAAGAVLDLGCGWGEFINHIAAREKYAMDLNPEAAERVASGVRFLKQDCSERWALADDTLDVVFTSNFFEHLPTKDALHRTIAEAHRCLKPGGRIICLGPNIKYLPGQYWDFWDHHLPLTEQSLAELLRMERFEPEMVIDRFLPYTMSGKRPAPLVFVRWYLKMPWAWRWFGKQFLVIATTQKN